MSSDEPDHKKSRPNEWGGGPQNWTKIFSLIKPSIGSSTALEGIVSEIFRKVGFSVGSGEALAKMVAKIAEGYNIVPYHNFGHAVHVFYNAYILLENCNIEFTVLERAAMLFSAIIHDLGHEGVSNMQLVNEDGDAMVGQQEEAPWEYHRLRRHRILLLIK